jgi:predicted RNA binding protein YcfA (HicA-like mRNA interferase family)
LNLKFLNELAASNDRNFKFTALVMGRAEHSNKTRDVTTRLREDGWIIARKGPGDHVQYKHATRPGRVTIDMGAREIPTGTLRSIYRQAGWEW